MNHALRDRGLRPRPASGIHKHAIGIRLLLQPVKQSEHLGDKCDDLRLTSSLCFVVGKDRHMLLDVNVLPFQLGEFARTAERPVEREQQASHWGAGAAAVSGIGCPQNASKLVIREIPVASFGLRLANVLEVVRRNESDLFSPVEASLYGVQNDDARCLVERLLEGNRELLHVKRRNAMRLIAAAEVNELLAAIAIRRVGRLLKVLSSVVKELFAEGGDGNRATDTREQLLLFKQGSECCLCCRLISPAFRKRLALAAKLCLPSVLLRVPPDLRTSSCHHQTLHAFPDQGLAQGFGFSCPLPQLLLRQGVL